MSTLKIEAVDSMSPEYRASIRTIPADLSPESYAASLNLCAPLHSIDSTKLGGKVTLDLRYGPDERHCLDLYVASDIPAERQPLMLFIHGGGFVGGNRRVSGSYLFANVAAWANRNGFAAAFISYRLAPSGQWPSGAEDIERALAWLADNSENLGISTERTVAIGHSAGASHLASWLAGHHGEMRGSSAICGAVLISGIFDPATLPIPGAYAYYGSDLTPASYSTVDGVASTNIPLLLVAAELDPPGFIVQWERMVSARANNKDAKTMTLIVPNQNHFTTVFHLGLQPDELGAEMAGFVDICLKMPEVFLQKVSARSHIQSHQGS